MALLREPTFKVGAEMCLEQTKQGLAEAGGGPDHKRGEDSHSDGRDLKTVTRSEKKPW